MAEGQNELFKTLCFLALMQHGEGLISKSPKYIMEKKKTSEDPRAAWNMLDWETQNKICAWAKRWNFSLPPII